MSLIATVQGYLKPCSKQLKSSVTLYPPLPYIMCNYADVVWIGQPDVNEQLV